MNGNRSVLFRQIDRETAMRRVVGEQRKAINRYLPLQTTRLARVLIMVLLLLMLPMCQKSTGRSHTTHDKTMISKPRFFPFFLHHLVMITDYSQNDETFYEI